MEQSAKGMVHGVKCTGFWGIEIGVMGIMNRL